MTILIAGCERWKQAKLYVKTIKDWYAEAPEEYRELLLRNTHEDDADKECDGWHQFCALGFCFLWSDTPEGKLFWSEFFMAMQDSRPHDLPSIPKKDEYAPWTIETAEMVPLRHKEHRIKVWMNYGYIMAWINGIHTTEKIGYDKLLSDWEQLDGSPCGVKV